MRAAARLMRAALLACGVAGAACVQAACLGERPLRGVNLAGAEFNPERMPGTLFKDYTYPAPADLQYFAAQGANAIRLPFRWERLQRSLGAALDAGELQAMRRVVGAAREHGLCVILDAHNFGTYARQSLGSPEVPVSAFVDFWLRVREAFPEAGHVAFGLMNEPAKTSRETWARAAQQVVTALRDNGAKHLLLVSGAGWSGAHDWSVRVSGVSNAEAFAGLHDPLRRSVLEVHQYADSDHSGTRADCMAPERMRRLMQRVAEWARLNRQRLFLGEFGTPPDAACLATLKAQLAAARDEPWAGWAYWAAGAWWGPHYVFGIHPLPGLPERAQLAVLREEWRR